MRNLLSQYLLSNEEKTNGETHKLINEIARINREITRIESLPINKIDEDSGTFNIQKPSKLNRDELFR